jgi:glucosamine--fructose-6-phosphate aminotransferase (isomerizing)
MCGIAAYLGQKQAYPILINLLKRLEYRGYDSAGLALLHNNKIKIYKETGAIEQIEASLQGKDTSGLIGLGHTRWATHGPATQINAHPHHSQDQHLTLVHNGTVTNYYKLKVLLKDNHYSFYSDTDSEVLVNYIDFIQKTEEPDLLKVLTRIASNIEGRSAFVIHDQNSPEQLVAFNAGGELYIGEGEDGQLVITSDKNALAGYARRFFSLNKDQLAVLTPKQLKLYNQDLILLEPNWEKMEVNVEELSKGAFPHFMLKEIFEQDKVVAETINSFLTTDEQIELTPEFLALEPLIKKSSRLIIIACGTSWHAGLVAKYFFAQLTNLPVSVEYASEFLPETIDSSDIVVAISQSGSTADTIRAVELAKGRGAKLIAICNVAGSTLARLADICLLTKAGIEIGVASTKAFTTQLVVLLLLAIRFGQIKNTITKELSSKLISQFKEIPRLIKEVLLRNKYIEDLAEKFSSAHNFLYLGRGLNYPIALEGALKLKEISYIHAEGLSAGEMKHGPIALIDKDMPVLVLAVKDEMYDRVINNIMEIKAREGRIIAVISGDDENITSKVDEVIKIPETNNLLLPFLSVIPLQFLAYYIARLKGANIDKPRNLAKSVTVE